MVNASLSQNTVRASEAADATTEGLCESSKSNGKFMKYNYRIASTREVNVLLAYLTFSIGHQARSAQAVISLVSSFVAGFGEDAALPLNSTRYKRLSSALPSKCSSIDALWDMFGMESSRLLARAPTVAAVDESMWRATHVVQDPADRVVVLMPRKPAGIGALAYLLEVKLVHSELPFLLVGVPRHADRNDTTPMEFLQTLVLKLRRVFADHGVLLKTTASVRNDNDSVVKVLRAGILDDEYRSFARYNVSSSSFECITAFDHFHNKSRHTIIRFTNCARPVSSELSAFLRDASNDAFQASPEATENIDSENLIRSALLNAKLAYGRALREEVQRLPNEVQRFFMTAIRGAVAWNNSGRLSGVSPGAETRDLLLPSLQSPTTDVGAARTLTSVIEKAIGAPLSIDDINRRISNSGSARAAPPILDECATQGALADGQEVGEEEETDVSQMVLAVPTIGSSCAYYTYNDLTGMPRAVLDNLATAYLKLPPASGLKKEAQ
eukprot:IDg5941t1